MCPLCMQPVNDGFFLLTGVILCEGDLHLLSVYNQTFTSSSFGHPRLWLDYAQAESSSTICKQHIINIFFVRTGKILARLATAQDDMRLFFCI